MMMVATVGARALPSGNPVVEMAPMGRRHILGIDAERLDRVDRFQHSLDLGPTGKPEQDFAAGPDAWHCRDRLSRLGGTQNVDTGSDRSMVICCPPDEGKDASGRKRNDAPTAVDDAFPDKVTETNPAFDAALLPIEFNLGEIVHPPHLLAFVEIRARRSRGVSATISPRSNAVILMWPFGSSVTSIVIHAVNRFAFAALDGGILPVATPDLGIVRAYGKCGFAVASRRDARPVAIEYEVRVDVGAEDLQLFLKILYLDQRPVVGR